MQLFKYYITNPYFIEGKSYPQQPVVRYFYRTALYIEEIKTSAYGYVKYGHRLTGEEIAKFKLIPAERG